MKKLVSILIIASFSLFSMSSLAQDAFPSGRIAAASTEPNGDGQELLEVNQAGVTVLGAGQQQAATCPLCMTAGNDRLPLTSRVARPGIQQQTEASGATGGGSNASPAGTGK